MRTFLVAAGVACLALTGCAANPQPAPASTSYPSATLFEPLNYLPLGSPRDLGPVTVTPPSGQGAMADIASAFTFRVFINDPKVTEVAVSLSIDGTQVCPPRGFTTTMDGLSYLDIPACTATLPAGEHLASYEVFWTESVDPQWLDTPRDRGKLTLSVTKFDPDKARSFPPPPFA